MADAPQGAYSIDYIEFQVRDTTEAKTFYGELFGWVFKDFGDSYTAFTDGSGLEGGFEQAESPSTGGPLIVLKAGNLESMYEKVSGYGATITKEIFAFPGGRRFEFADPTGNRLAVWGE